MQITIENLQMRIDRLRSLLDKCPSLGIDTPEDIQHILKTAPDTLREAENVIRTNNPALLGEVSKALEQAEFFITWTTKTIEGEATAQAIKNGRETDSTLAAEQRLLNRILKFLLTKVDGPAYLQKVKEFSGENAVDGTTVYMDPIAESEAFSQWLIHDICLPGESRCAIDLFAENHLAELPEDEKALLKLRQADRPSVYKVVDLSGNHEAPGIFLLQDMLSPSDSIRVWDISSSKTLTQGAVILGRAIPYDEKSDLYNLLGSVTELPKKLWEILSPYIDQWKIQHIERQSPIRPCSFYRAIHARLRCKILEITQADKPSPSVSNVKISLSQKTIASDIHKFVMKTKRKGKDVESIMDSPHLIKYMNKFKRLMDMSNSQEIDSLSARYEGFYDFAILMENLATAISEGKIKVP